MTSQWDSAGPGDGAAPGAAGPASEPSTSDIRPRLAWFWIGAAILVLGVGGACGWFGVSVASMVNAPDDYQRVSVPGERSLLFTEAGTYDIFGEISSYSSLFGGRSSLRDPRVSVKSDSGESIAVIRDYSYANSSNYSTGGYSGYKLSTVSIPRAGTYTVTVGDLSGTNTRPNGFPRSTTTSYFQTTSDLIDVQRIAVGKSASDRGVAGMFGSMALGGTAFMVGLVVLIVCGVKRSSSRRKLFPPPQPPQLYGAGPFGGYGPPGYGPPGYGPPGYGPPGYGPPGYGPPGYGPPTGPAYPTPPPPAADPANRPFPPPGYSGTGNEHDPR